ncbi:hypothetical protein X737_28190 [Mesorhizobium sp. L48C026A00]|nr:hypothetical protein X737_28190 [Mesorhizobium sp. L48C026A00]
MRTRSASALPEDIDTLEAMLVAKRWREAELQQLRSETAELKA